MPEQTKASEPAEQKRRLNIWLIVSIVLAIALVGVIVVNAMGGSKSSEEEGMVVLKVDDASDKLLEFINKVYGPQVGQATFKESSEENGLYKVTVTVVDPTQNKPVDQTVYLTKDAKLFIPQAIDIDVVSQQYDALQQQQLQAPTAQTPEQTTPAEESQVEEPAEESAE